MDRTDASETCWRPADCEGDSHCQPRCSRFLDREGEPWQIRPAGGDDAAALVEMYDDFAASERAQGLPPRTCERIADWVEDRLADGCNVVATDGAAVVGHALYTPTDDPEPEFAVFVHQDVQGRGLGTELSKHVLVTAAAADREALTLIVETSNRVARRLYDRLGFETVDESEAGCRRRPSVRMRRSLAGAVEEYGHSPALARDAHAAAGPRVDSD